jgi:ribonuclease J
MCIEVAADGPAGASACDLPPSGSAAGLTHSPAAAAAADGTAVLLDLGMPLSDAEGADYPFDTPQLPTAELLRTGVLRDIPGLYADDPRAPRFAAIILTHSHLDHYGLAHHAHPAIPVYGSRGTLAILEVGRVFFPRAALPADLRLLPDGEPLRLGSITVTGISVDHSAPDSRALLVEADGQKLVYSGDLRAHGRTGFRFEKLLADTRLHDADWLLLEGTTLGAGSGGGPAAAEHGLRSEQEVEEALVALARGSGGATRPGGVGGMGHDARAHHDDPAGGGRGKLVAVVASGQNLDRLVSCYRAARRSGRLLVIDPYQAYVLMKLAPLSPSIPQFTWEDVRVSFAPHQVEKLKDAGLMDLAKEMGRSSRVGSDELAADPGRYLLCTRGSRGAAKLLTKVGAANVELVWSMWGGYWRRPGCAMREWAEREGVVAHFIHSGGHAWPEDLERLKAALHPRACEIVHTAPQPKPRHVLQESEPRGETR